jgi:adenylylsulfate kinase-like enzyme
MINDRIIYHPTKITQEIFKCSKERYSTTKYFYGLSGTGKSYSLSLLVVLHNFIDSLRSNFKYVYYKLC